MDRKNIKQTLDILEYVIDVRRRVYSTSYQSYIIWGLFSSISGVIYLLGGFWPIWFILFIFAGFAETSRSTGVQASLIGWGLAAVVMVLGVLFSIRLGVYWPSAAGFGVAAFLGFTLPFTVNRSFRESEKNTYLGRVIGLTWVTLVIATLVGISATVTLSDIRSIFWWMVMVGTGYTVMGIIISDIGPVVGGGLTFLSIIIFSAAKWNPIALTIVVGLISIGVGIYARGRA